MNFFSIITICRNNLGDLITTYNSIRHQSLRDFEWIVVDGDSQDGTKEWLQKNRIANWKSERDKGIFDAMNKGIQRASGRYLIFMNSGDSFASDQVLEKVSEQITENNYPGFVYGDSIDVDEAGREFYRRAKNVGKNRIGMITQHQAMFFARNAVGSLLYSDDFPITADYAFISEVLKKLDAGDVLKLNLPISKFSMGGTNEQRRFKALKEDFRIRRDIIGVPLAFNFLLYTLHYLHTLLKKNNPALRFFRHQKLENSPTIH